MHKYIQNMGGVGGTVYTPHMAMYSAMMFVPTHTMFVPIAILSQKCKKTEKIGVPCLSRMGDLLNTRRNVQNFVPGGSRGGPPLGGPFWPKPQPSPVRPRIAKLRPPPLTPPWARSPPNDAGGPSPPAPPCPSGHGPVGSQPPKEVIHPQDTTRDVAETRQNFLRVSPPLGFCTAATTAGVARINALVG